MIEDLVRTAITILVFLFVLGGLVLIHEVGHFVTARLARVRVLEFGIGFPPRAKVLRAKGETLYTLNWLPIGGFVKLEGEDGDEERDPRSFASQRLPIKLIILVAGVAMNLVVSFVIFTGTAMAPQDAIGIRIATVQAGSPADTAGLEVDEVIVAIDGRRYGVFDIAPPSQDPTRDLRAKAGQEVTLLVRAKDGTERVVTARLRTPEEAAGQGALGISLAAVALEGESVAHSLGEAIPKGWDRTGGAFGMILGGLGDLGNSIVSNPTAPPPAAGPVGIAAQLGDILWNLGPLYVLYVAGLLSANLALVNVLPFPPLDGGRMLMLVLKALPAGNRISLRAERLTYVVGFVALFTFLIWITIFDVSNLLGGGTP